MGTAYFWRRLALVLIMTVLTARWAEQFWYVFNLGNVLLVVAGITYIVSEVIPAARALLRAMFAELEAGTDEQEMQNEQ